MQDRKKQIGMRAILNLENEILTYTKDLTKNKSLEAQGTPDSQAKFKRGCDYENRARKYKDNNETKVKKNSMKAVKHFRQASEQDLTVAQLKMGYCYEEGFGVEKNAKEAFGHYESAARFQEMMIESLLPRSPSEEMIKQSILPQTFEDKNLLATARCKLAMCYEKGYGVAENIAEAKNLYHNAAQNGNAVAQNNLARCYEQDGNSKLAIKWYWAAALNYKHPVAQYNLALCYEIGWEVPKSFETAVNLYILAAKQGNPHAQASLGCYFEVGLSVKKDLLQALYWYSLAAEKNAFAQSKLGEFFLRGGKAPTNWAIKLEPSELNEKKFRSSGSIDNYIIVQKNPERAFDYFRKAAEYREGIANANANANAQYYLGYCYEYGSGTAANMDMAIKYYKKSAEQGSPMAQTALGRCYEMGKNVEKNPVVSKDAKQALHYYQLAANQNYEVAQENLARCYREGIGVAKDEVKAAHWYRLLYRQPLIKSERYSLDLIDKESKQRDEKTHQKLMKVIEPEYYYQQAISHDSLFEGPSEAAIKNFFKAAHAGHAKALYVIANCYEHGLSIFPQNIGLAAKLYELATKQKIGNDPKVLAMALLNLGNCYALGLGVKKNEERAVLFYKKASDQGAVNGAACAQYNLGHCYAYGIGVKKSDVGAAHYYRLAAERGIGLAQYNMGYCYEYGLGVEKNIPEAIKWYQSAASQDIPMAKYQLASIQSSKQSSRIDYARLAKNSQHEAKEKTNTQRSASPESSSSIYRTSTIPLFSNPSINPSIRTTSEPIILQSSGPKGKL